jgi:hypothetical protein
MRGRIGADHCPQARIIRFRSLLLHAEAYTHPIVGCQQWRNALEPQISLKSGG